MNRSTPIRATVWALALLVSPAAMAQAGGNTNEPIGGVPIWERSSADENGDGFISEGEATAAACGRTDGQMAIAAALGVAATGITAGGLGASASGIGIGVGVGAIGTGLAMGAGATGLAVNASHKKNELREGFLNENPTGPPEDPADPGWTPPPTNGGGSGSGGTGAPPDSAMTPGQWLGVLYHIRDTSPDASVAGIAGASADVTVALNGAYDASLELHNATDEAGATAALDDMNAHLVEYEAGMVDLRVYVAADLAILQADPHDWSDLLCTQADYDQVEAAAYEMLAGAPLTTAQLDGAVDTLLLGLVVGQPIGDSGDLADGVDDAYDMAEEGYEDLYDATRDDVPGDGRPHAVGDVDGGVVVTVDTHGPLADADK